jgi:hypothetical protein
LGGNTPHRSKLKASRCTLKKRPFWAFLFLFIYIAKEIQQFSVNYFRQNAEAIELGKEEDWR